MKCLLVGAGAVGQVYGRHLQAGGAEVTFMVRPKYAEAARSGFPLYPLNRRDGRAAPVLFTDFDVVTTPGEVATRGVDAIFLCTSSTALRSGSWFSELALASGNATIVILTVGLQDHDFVCRYVAAERICTGLIGMMSYQAPLPGEDLQVPGTAYWFPPLMKCPFSGDVARTRAIVAVMRRGLMPTAVHKDVRLEGVFGSALLQTSIYALECAGWSIRGLRRDRVLLATAHRAMREATEIGARTNGARAPMLQRLLRPWHLGGLLQLTARVAPLDVEQFFAFHYTKVRAQSLDMLETWIRAGEESGLSTPGLRELRDRLAQRAPADAAAPNATPPVA